MKRIYEILLQEHLRENRQMIFISGPRQVGKTTLVKRTLPHGHYLNYDTPADSQVIVKGASQVAKALDMANPLVRRSGVIFDELHKFPQWKKFLKGFFDSYGTGTKIAVTGSARLNVYKRGGDSLM